MRISLRLMRQAPLVCMPRAIGSARSFVSLSSVGIARSMAIPSDTTQRDLGAFTPSPAFVRYASKLATAKAKPAAQLQLSAIYEPTSLKELKAMLDALDANAVRLGRLAPRDERLPDDADVAELADWQGVGIEFCTIKAVDLRKLHAYALEQRLLPQAGEWEVLDELGAKFDPYTAPLFDMATLVGRSGLFVNFGVLGVVVARVNPADGDSIDVWKLDPPEAAIVRKEGSLARKYVPNNGLRLAGAIAARSKGEDPMTWNEHDFTDVVQGAEIVAKTKKTVHEEVAEA